MSGTIAYVADESSLQIIDVSDPENPCLLSAIQPHNDSFIVSKPLIIGDQLMVADNGWNEILTYDVSEPANPESVGSYLWNLSTWDMAVYDNCLATANSWHGISILNLEGVPVDEVEITGPVDVCNYPNPFNTSTTISFSIPKSIKEPKIKIYNIKGQRIRELKIKNLKLKIKEEVIWDGTDARGNKVPSGVYFYRISGLENVPVQKMILIR
ncbi:MAG: T9SS type A sorting domain-containing protein [Candidatus Cloacimonadia bacterium]